MDDQGVSGSSQGVLGSSQDVSGSSQGTTKPKSRAEYQAQYHRKKLDTLKKEKPKVYAEKLAQNKINRKNLEILKSFRAQQKKDIALKKEIAQNLDFDPNVFDSDVSEAADVSAAEAAADTNFDSELDGWVFELDPNKDESGSAQLASATDHPFGGKIKSFGL